MSTCWNKTTPWRSWLGTEPGAQASGCSGFDTLYERKTIRELVAHALFPHRDFLDAHFQDDSTSLSFARDRSHSLFVIRPHYDERNRSIAATASKLGLRAARDS